MTKQHTPTRPDNASREAAPKRVENAAIELVEAELKRVVGGSLPDKWSQR
jgi:hypothetical protein